MPKLRTAYRLDHRMNWTRKQKRKELHKTHCCGKQMSFKPGYGYVCEKCGKRKRVRNEKSN